MEGFLARYESLPRDAEFWGEACRELISRDFAGGMELVGQVLSRTGCNDSIDNAFLQLNKSRVQECVQNVEDGGLAESNLKQLLNTAEKCSLDSPQKFSAGSVLWKGLASLLEKIRDDQLASEVLISMSTTAESLELQIARILGIRVNEQATATAEKLLKVLRFFKLTIERTSEKFNISDQAFSAVAKLAVCTKAYTTRIRAAEQSETGVGRDGGMITKALEHMMLDKPMSTVAAASGIGGTGPGSGLFWKRVRSILALQSSTNDIDAVEWDLGKLLVCLEMCYRSITNVTGSPSPLMSFDILRRVFNEVIENSSSLERGVEGSRSDPSLFDACHVVLVDISISLTRSSEACVELSKLFVSMALAKSAFRRMLSMIVLDRMFSQVNSLRRRVFFGFIVEAAKIATAFKATRQRRILVNILRGFIKASTLSAVERREFARKILAEDLDEALFFVEENILPGEVIRELMEESRLAGTGKEQVANRCLDRTALTDHDVERLLERFCSEESVFQLNLILQVLGPLPSSQFSTVSKELLGRVFAKLVGIGKGGVLIQYPALRLVKKCAKLPRLIEVAPRVREYWTKSIGTGLHGESVRDARLAESAIDFCRYVKATDPWNLIPTPAKEQVLILLESKDSSAVLSKRPLNSNRSSHRVTTSNVCTDALFSNLLGIVSKLGKAACEDPKTYLARIDDLRLPCEALKSIGAFEESHAQSDVRVPTM
ncbi:hypothetical protein NDN08_004714 [Rhodosorus marinus]|uniref:Uncharacterized protein n=1 Tax=Rhodosorus marinus TaxID=101924 RepID=A0AAV8UM19_9RHOD|nr:hypothetical protein NDN08_004714 [Rhodosorus marinus]